MTRIIVILGVSIISGILYRLGGKTGFNTKLRDVGCSLLICALIGLFGGLNTILGWLCLPVCFGLAWAALTTYRYFLPKPKDYSWYHYALHGFFVAFAAFPYALVTKHYLGFGLRCLVCAVGLGVWYHLAKWNDDLHEWGRGFILTLTVPLMFLPI